MKHTVFFDLETGGLDEAHPVIQLAAIAVRTDSGEFIEVEEFERKIDFVVSTADPAALEMNSYDPAVWERDSVSQALVFRDFAEFLKRYASVRMVSKRTGRPYWVALLSGHNASTFDGPRLFSAYKKIEMFLPAFPAVRDTRRAAEFISDSFDLDYPSFKLSDLCDLAGIKIGGAGAHDALADVRATAKLAAFLRGKITGIKVPYRELPGDEVAVNAFGDPIVPDLTGTINVSTLSGVIGTDIPRDRFMGAEGEVASVSVAKLTEGEFFATDRTLVEIERDTRTVGARLNAPHSGNTIPRRPYQGVEALATVH